MNNHCHLSITIYKDFLNDFLLFLSTLADDYGNGKNYELRRRTFCTCFNIVFSVGAGTTIVLSTVLAKFYYENITIIHTHTLKGSNFYTSVYTVVSFTANDISCIKKIFSVRNPNISKLSKMYWSIFMFSMHYFSCKSENY